MPLTIIKGPPNSGRTELVRQQYAESLRRRPVLVVPSTDDIFDWERRLAAADGAFLGNRIMHFKDLVTEVLGLPGDQPAHVASGLQRRYLVQKAFETSWEWIARRVERQPGLIDAMLDVIDEFRNGLIGVDAVEERAEADESAYYLADVARVYRTYLELLEESGLTDNPAMALQATRVPLQGWQGRPVFVAGFDDLTNQQLELLVRLGKETDVTIAITHEQQNPAMAVTQKLLDRLRERGAVDGPTTERPENSDDHRDLLFEIQKRFMRPTADPISPDPELEPFSHGDTGDLFTLMRSSGRRGEAEAVAGEIARLIAGGTSPGQIAIAVTSPASNGQAFQNQLIEYGIPVTLESETPATSAITGQTILALLRASCRGTAADLIIALRGPLGVDSRQVDRLEAIVLREGLVMAAEAAERFAGITTASLPFWSELSDKEPADKAELIADIAERIGGNVLTGDRSPVPRPDVAAEIQMATAIGRACREIARIQGQATALDVDNAIVSGAIKTWAIPASNAVRIASPYSLRAKRFDHLFMVSLQERGFGEADRSGPFLTPDSREALGLPEFTDPELQELYLFYSCLSVPTEGLWLSSRVADEEGKPEQPSPLIEEVTGLFDESRVKIRRTGRSSSTVTFAPDQAPSRAELARSLAALPTDERTKVTEALDLTGLDGPAISASISSAVVTESSTRELSKISDPAARARLEEADTFSATAIETFLSCPYRWFIERVLRPSRFGPDPEPMSRGNLVHAVLAGVYSNHPGVIPEPADVDEWIAEVEVLTGQLPLKGSIGLGGSSAAHRTNRRQVVNAVAGFLHSEAGRQSPGYLPFELEGAFGHGDGGKPALDMDGWMLRGSIDRIDGTGNTQGRRAIVLDYKTGAKSAKSWANIQKEKKVQLQLYMLAARELWQVEPVAGLYVPVLRSDAKPRGVVAEPYAGTVSDLNPQVKDRVDDLGAEIEAAVELADEVVGKMRAGDIEHDPATCPNHLNHAAVPDWTADADGSNNAKGVD